MFSWFISPKPVKKQEDHSIDPLKELETCHKCGGNGALDWYTGCDFCLGTGSIYVPIAMTLVEEHEPFGCELCLECRSEIG